MVPPVLWRARTRSVHGPAAGHEFWLQVPECATLPECPPDKLALEVMPAPSSWKKRNLLVPFTNFMGCRRKYHTSL